MIAVLCLFIVLVLILKGRYGWAFLALLLIMFAGGLHP